jgi:hypothetical protein
MPLAGFKPTITVFKLAKIFDALDRAVTVAGSHIYICKLFSICCEVVL